MRRTYCYGSCPVYSLEIFADGRVVYEGADFVAVTGRQTSKISAEEVKDLIRAFLATHYFSLKKSYRTQKNPDGTYTEITDLPTTYTSFRYKGRFKSIEDYAFAPAKLSELEKKIDRAVNVNQWLLSRDTEKSDR